MIYISGAITGVEDFHIRFSDAERLLTRQGHKVINPARLQVALPPLLHSQYMVICMAELSLCDKIYMLKGYENSRGANMELEWAREHGLEIIMQ